VRQIRKRLTYANVTATIALFMALGGATAIAASRLPRNSVGPRQLQPNAVRTGFLDKNAVRTGKIAFEAVRAGKIAKNAVVTNRLRDGAVSGAKLANQAVGTGKLGNESVQTGKIGSGAISTGKIEDDAVTGPKVKESTLDQVPSAAEADKVGGHSAACPGGMRAVAGLCADTDPRAGAEWKNAAKDCADEQALLPSVGQLLALSASLGNVSTGAGEWTDSFYVTSTGEERAVTVTGEGFFGYYPATSSEPTYRCVTQLLR